MKVVVDLGCATYGSIDSLTALVEEYHPDVIYGFDPAADLSVTEINGVPIKLEQAVAWTSNGEVGFVYEGWGSRVVEGTGVRCFDFVRWLRQLRKNPRVKTVYVKMDVEGSEVLLVQDLIRRRASRLIDELLVEWHGAGEELEAQLKCPVRRWWM